MTETLDAALREAQKQAGEIYLAGHLEKHDMEQEAVTIALAADRSRLEDHRIAHEAAHEAHKDLHRVTEEAHKEQHLAEQRAVLAAQNSMELRLNSMNEFRDQLRDQASTFLRREQLETFVTQYERAHDEVVQQIRTEREERRAAEAAHALIHRGEEGVKKGMSQYTAIIVGAVGVAATVISVVVIIANFVSSP